MPEGPTIVLLRGQAARFRGKTVREASGNAKIDLSRMEGRRVKAVRTWGKHLLFEFAGFSLRVHLLLFGSFRFDDPRRSTPRLRLVFDDGQVDFYASSVKYVEGRLEDTYDWRGDIMSDAWDPRHVRRVLKAMPDTYACDALLDQDVFAGVGNIIKNEVLFRVRLHPLSRVGEIPSAKLGDMIKQARVYGFEFLEHKRDGTLDKHLCVHDQDDCPRCGVSLHVEELGKTKRRAFWCGDCQELHD